MSRRWAAVCVLGLAAVAAGIAVLRNRPATVESTPGLTERKLLFAGADAGYVDSAVCAQCHGAIAKTYARTGMARSFGTIHADTPVGMFPEGSFQHKASEQSFTMFRRDGKPFLRRRVAGPDGASTEHREAEVHYWFGSGERGRGFVHRSGSGKLLLLPLTWYAEGGGSWGMNPGYDRPVHQGFDRVIDYRCLSCHAGFPEIEPGANSRATGWQYPGKLVEGIDCQRCHGPGQRHVEAIRQGQKPDAVRGAIVNPARLPADRRIEVCLQCHLETTSVPLPNEVMRFDRGVFSYRPGQKLSDWILTFDYAPGSGHDNRIEFVSSVYRLFQSPCFRQSGGALTCTTCHNPHDIPRGAAAIRHYSTVCQKCHETKVAELVRAQRHPAAADCVSCHMPMRTPVDAIRVRVADHFIRKRPQPQAPVPMAEQVDVRPYRGEVIPYYPSNLERTPETELYLAVAQVAEQSNLKQGAARLEELVKRHQPKQGEFYLQLGNAWGNLGRPDKSRQWLEEAVRRMPSEWRPLVALGNTLDGLGEPDRAVELLRRASALAPREPAPLTALGGVYLRQSKWSEATEAYRAALRSEPESAQTHNSLGSALIRSGDAAGAEHALREAVRLRPEIPQMRVDLASLLVLAGNFTEARRHFELALRLDPGFADGHAAYATALAQSGLLSEARLHYDQAARLSPTDPVTHHNLAAVLVQLGQPEAAIREYQAALRFAPDYHEAHLGLGRLYGANGQGSAAVPHLRKATESQDPEVRQEAAALLAQLRR